MCPWEKKSEMPSWKVQVHPFQSWMSVFDKKKGVQREEVKECLQLQGVGNVKGGSLQQWKNNQNINR